MADFFPEPTDAPVESPSSFDPSTFSSGDFGWGTPSNTGIDGIPVASPTTVIPSEFDTFAATPAVIPSEFDSFPVATTGAPPAAGEFDFQGMAAPVEAPTFFVAPTEIPAASPLSFTPPSTTTSAYLSGGDGITPAYLSGGASTLASPPAAESPSSSSPSPYLSGTAPLHEQSDFIRQYEVQLERKREEQAQREAQQKAELEARAKEELARFYEERRKKAEAVRTAYRESHLGSDDAAPESDAAAWQNVGKFVDMQAAPPKGRDISRLKEILISMRH